MSHAPSEHVDHCLNCGAPTPRAYCPECGQHAVGADVSFRQQLALFIEEVFTLESRLLPTLKLLFLRPGELTRAYNGGQRVRYMTPLKLYLIGSFLLFFALGHIPGIAHAQFVRYTSDPTGTRRELVFGELREGQERITEAWIDERAKLHPPESRYGAWLNERRRAMVKDPPAFLAAAIDAASKVTVLLLPVHALLLQIAYLRSRRRFGAHLVFSFHLHAFVYAATALLVVFELTGLPDTWALLAYLAWVRRTFPWPRAPPMEKGSLPRS